MVGRVRHYYTLAPFLCAEQPDVVELFTNLDLFSQVELVRLSKTCHALHALFAEARKRWDAIFRKAEGAGRELCADMQPRTSWWTLFHSRVVGLVLEAPLFMVKSFLGLECTKRDVAEHPGLMLFLMGLAAGRGRLDVLKWHHATTGRVCSYVVRHALRGGQVDVVRWALGIEKLPRDAFKVAADAGQLAMLKWLCNGDEPPPATGDVFVTERARHLALFGEQRGYVIVTHRRDRELCTLAARGGHLAVLQWLVANWFSINVPVCYSMAHSCGRSDVVAWMESVYPAALTEKGAFGN